MTQSNQRLLLIIPAYNEGKSIQLVVEELKQQNVPGDFIVINDGSRDDTAAVCRRMGYPMLDLPINLGLSGAFRAGMQHAMEHGYAYALQLDGDGQHDPRYIAPMLHCMQENRADIVIGSRFVNQKKPHTLRMMGSNLISFFIRLTCKQPIADPTSGMRLYNRKMIEIFAKSSSYTPEPDTLAFLLRKGAKMAEFPVEMREREFGTSYLSFARSIRYMMEMSLSILLIMWIRKKED